MDLTTKIAGVYDKVRTRFFEDQDLVFLKVSEAADAFDTVTTISASWFLEYNNFRQKFKVEVAVNEDGFNEGVVTATHLQVGDDIYVISEADTIKPKGIDFTWKFYCERFFRKNQYSNIY